MKISKKIITRVLGHLLKKFFPKTVYPNFLFLRTKKNFRRKNNQLKQSIKFSNNLDEINSHEYKYTSQNNEDGIIEYIFQKIPNNKYFVEIGLGYYEFNSLNLIKKGWNGKLIDIDDDEIIALKKNLAYFYPKAKIDLINKKITKENINDIVFSNNFNKKIDFFSIDIDGNDYWALKEMNLSNVNVICCEFNPWIKNEKIAIKYDENFIFEDNGIYGASLSAYTELLNSKGFSLIAVESSGTNAFFVNNNFKDKFKILSPITSYKFAGRFYNSDKKKEIFENVRKNLDRFTKV